MTKPTEDEMLEHGIKIELVNRAHLQAVLKSLEDPAATERDTGKLVAAAMRRFVKMDDTADCDVCGGRGPASLEACPYCGTISDVDDDDEISKPGEVEAGDVEAGDVEAAAVVVPVTEPVASAPTNGASTTALVKRTKTRAGIARVVEPAKPEDVVVVEVHGAEVIPSDVLETDDFDTAHRWCRDAKVAGAVSLWRLGHGIGVMVDKKLWQQRKKGGKQVYKSFDAYCFEQLGMTHGNAYELMDVAKRFTPTQVRAWGTTKCGLLLRAPDEARPEIEGKLASGELKTTRETKVAVQEARARAGTTGKPRATGRKPMPQPKARRVSDKITVAMTKPTRILQFVTRATAKSEEPKLAKFRVVGDPVVEIELTNRVKMRISLSNDSKGNVVGRMSIKRDEP